MSVFNIHHITKYEYDRPVKESVNEIKIYPFNSPSQLVLYHEINITGNPEIMVATDYWSNRAGMFNLMPAHTELMIESKLIVRSQLPEQDIKNFRGDFDQLHVEVAKDLSLIELSRSEKSHLQDEIDNITEEIKTSGCIVNVVENCCHYIFNNFQYVKGITTIETTVEEILQHRSGVCQDFAHVMLEVLRNLQIPGRYVSGYICPNKNGMRGEGATHAWVEAWIPGYGWAGIDPTNDVWVNNRHVKLAVGRNFNDCSPVKGTFKGPAKQSLSVYVSVGYEDGQTFEEMSKVKLEKQSEENEDPAILESLAGQQQQ
ncbi:MAG TPA: transglutaminase family protein [Chitinophagaceae bacterium]|jgi:transglutaminase-like putative cysteine protease|nr:transglutaminase family protein [Chitinophagaceae bacterium]